MTLYDGMAHAMNCSMASSRVDSVCPHCGSHSVTLLEHGSGVTVFRCEHCARATIQRWTPAAPPLPEVEPNKAFARLPAWFISVGGR